MTFRPVLQRRLSAPLTRERRTGAAPRRGRILLWRAAVAAIGAVIGVQHRGQQTRHGMADFLGKLRSQDARDDLAADVQAGPAGALHDYPVAVGGGVKCWGLNDSGQLGATGNRVDIDAFLVLGR